MRGPESPSLLGLADFVADDAADGRTADGSDRAAVGQQGASHTSGYGVAVMIRHPDTSTQTDQHR